MGLSNIQSPLAKIFTTLFDRKIDAIQATSKFIFIDFNGEYTGNQLANENYKNVLRLRTRGPIVDRFVLRESEFWDAETLGILFQATANTQRPFLRRVVNGRNRFIDIEDSLLRYLRATFDQVLRSNDPSAEALEQLKHLARALTEGEELLNSLENVGLRRPPDNTTFHYVIGPGNWRFLSDDEAFVESEFLQKLDEFDLDDIDGFDELQIRATLQLIRDVTNGSAQYDHIHPLLRRIDALRRDLAKVIRVGGEVPAEQAPITVISLREAKQEIKKIIPILIAKHYYEEHKEDATSPPTSTLHLVIDEAHNILSLQSSREAESWKDYRLELFEEVIKEGRKFGMFVVIASQRPSDISPTIVSQVHNFFIHRLVNDRDLALLENSISTLDTLSRSQIPTLPKGACVVTGTTFDIPMLLQIEKLDIDKEPDSRDVDLRELWN